MFKTTAVRLTGLLACVTLVGCASVQSVSPGTPLAQVLERYGNPNVSCPDASGGTRMIWSEQPSGEQAWATVVGANKTVGPFEQILTASAFQQLDQGQWNSGKVRCAFGPPAKMLTFAEHPNHVVWEYRYLGAGESFEMLFVSFEIGTNVMTGWRTGMDPTLNPLITGR